MLAIRLTFPAGRYHATPWGRHVNEGVAEWPPSPYRFLRSLYDVWQRKCPTLPEDAVRNVLGALAGEPPVFVVPAATAAHTRSYLSANEVDPTAKNLVFDPFLVFEQTAECFVQWRGLSLQSIDRETLGLLLSQLNYLGRSESWVNAELWTGRLPGGYVCEPLSTASVSGVTVPVACTVPPSEYDQKDWLTALTFSTADLLKKKVSAPPLLKPVRYVMPEAAVQTDPARRAVPARSAVSEVMLALDGTVLPLVTATLEVGEQIRVRLMGAHKKRMGGDESRVSPAFSGKQKDGSKRLDHGHVYILPLASDDSQKQGRIDRVLIRKPGAAFTPDELDAVRGVQRLWQSGGRPEVRAVIVWQGEKWSRHGEATTFESATPFVSPRHWRKGRDYAAFLEAEVRRECQNHGLPVVVTVRIAARLKGLFDILEFRRNRKQDPVRPGVAIEITFDEPVSGPFAIGYGAHFGLGQFRPKVD